MRSWRAAAARPKRSASIGSSSAAAIPAPLRTLALPFSGRWRVWQGFNGRWTHRGAWRHACDFVIADEQGKTHRGDGSRLHDYYCYRMPVLAPVRGRVLKVVDDVEENLAGRVDGDRNWGNLVLLEDPRGFCVEVSHFAHRTIRVQEGQSVERGAMLGLCGNSGYSAQPHIHVQVQADARVGAPTLPFSFVSYRHGDVYHANDLPHEQRRRGAAGRGAATRFRRHVSSR